MLLASLTDFYWVNTICTSVLCTEELSVNSPDYGPLPPNSPGWCLAPFDPEGILSSLVAAVTTFVGLHFGHIIAHFKDHIERIFLWSPSAFSLLILGYILLALGMPFSKPLYTVSYMCITAGASGLIFAIIFYLVDVKHIRKPVMLLQWMEMNALLIYALAACEIFPGALQGFYWGSPENNLIPKRDVVLKVTRHNTFGSFVKVKQTKSSFPFGSCTRTNIDNEDFAALFFLFLQMNSSGVGLKHKVTSITDLLTHYKGKFRHYDVNNEKFD